MTIQQFLNPFAHLSDRLLWLMAFGATVFGMLIAIYFNVSFDGCFDVHFIEKISILNAIFYLVTSIAILSLVLFTSGKITNPKTRFIDILITVCVARIPLYLLGLMNINNYNYLKTSYLQEIIFKSNGDISKITIALQSMIPFLILSSITALAALLLFFVLLFNGYKNATNIKSTTPIIYFVIAVIIAETISKILISFF